MKAIIGWIIFGCGILFVTYRTAAILDAGAELTDARNEADSLRERSELVLVVAKRVWVGKSADSVASLATDLSKSGFRSKKTEAGNIEIEELIFEIQGGVVSDLKFFD